MDRHNPSKQMVPQMAPITSKRYNHPTTAYRVALSDDGRNQVARKGLTLRLAELRAAFRLLGECQELGADPVAWRVHMLRGLCKLVDAQVGIGGDVGLPGDGKPREALPPVEVGWPTASERARWAQFCHDLAVRPTPICRRWWAPPRGRLVTRTREQVVEKQAWHRSLDFNGYHKPCGLDESLISLHLLPQAGAVSGFSLHRELRRQPLGARQQQLVQIFHAELGPLVGRSLAAAGQPSFVDLSPRERQTLACLLEGDSEKQVAARLVLSRATVHEYVTSLYRHFGVSSRAELLARFLRHSPCLFEQLRSQRAPSSRSPALRPLPE
jgi:DNA-binding CsgD family transcriptional regulator